MEVGVLLEVLWPEVVAPEDDELLFTQLGVLLLYGHIARERLGIGLQLALVAVQVWLAERLHELKHSDYGVGCDLRRMGVVDATGNVAVRVCNGRRAQSVSETQQAG